MPDLIIAAFDGSFLSSIAAVSDAFAMANDFIDRNFKNSEHKTTLLNVRLSSIGERKTISTPCGKKLASDVSWRSIEQCRLVFIPAFTMEDIHEAAQHVREYGDFVQWLGEQSRRGTMIAGSAAAVAFLAQAGFLENGRAAVHDALRPLFRRQYPRITIDEEASVVGHRQIYTSSAVGNDGELAIELIRESMAPTVASWVNYRVRFQAQRVGDVPYEGAETRDPVVQSVCRYIWENFASRIDFRALAAEMAVSERTLVRRFELALNRTPHHYLQTTRIEASKRLLSRTSMTVERAAAMVGYSDLRHFRTIFRQAVGVSPSKYRQQSIGKN